MQLLHPSEFKEKIMSEQNSQTTTEKSYAAQAASSVGKAFVWGLKTGSFIAGVALPIVVVIAIGERLKGSS
jgi:hypothetical protein